MKNKITCYIEAEFWYGDLPEPFQGIGGGESELWDKALDIAARSVVQKSVYAFRHQENMTKAMIVWMSMVLIGSRESTLPEDMIYSVLGILELEDYKAHYEIGFKEARLAVFESLKETILPMTLCTDWGFNPVPGDNDSALPRIQGSEPTLGIDMLECTALAMFDRKVGTTIHSRKERFRVWKDPQRRQTRDLGVMRTTLRSMTSRLMILYCASLFDNPSYLHIPISRIPDEDVHVLIIDGSRMTDKEYSSVDFKYDCQVTFIELGKCMHHALFADPQDEMLMHHNAVLALECVDTTPGYLANKGTALILNASMLSGDITASVIQ